MKRFENKVAVVTGTSRGLGQAIVFAFAREGAHVVGLGISDNTDTASVTKALACEWAKERIKLNAVATGYIASENTLPLRNDETRNAAILARIPEGRWVVPEDIAGS